MNTPEIEKMTGAIRQLADAITPTNAAGSHDASGGYVTSHTEAVMGLTAAMQSIASSISDLADAVRESLRERNSCGTAADGGCPPATCSESSWTPETAVQWTPRAKKMLALARKVAIYYGQNYVGSEHLLAGIIREKEGFAARVLEAHGLTMEWLIKACGWQTMADRIEERERAEYERLRAKFDPQNAKEHTTPRNEA